MKNRGHGILRAEIVPEPTSGIITVIGGNIANLIPLVKYVGDDDFEDLDQLYDPETDTEYPDGLGYGERKNIYGQFLDYVLIRHNFAEYPNAVVAGRSFQSFCTVLLTVASGADMDKQMLAYVPGFSARG